MLPQSLAHRILVQMELAGDSPDDRVQDAVARSKPVKEYVDALWPAVDPARLVLPAAVGRRRSSPRPPTGSSTPDEQAALLWAKPPRVRRRGAAGRCADAVLLDEAADLVERTPSLGPRRRSTRRRTSRR